ncbi:hypothetical protein ACHAAC_01075 [Aeromicrobium sp. CF4.19]|uniref:hypothetical protein n=1 Tax=Aeromicrobium sp. CF4.19 TaxID=3373082 RepID=UPI003EE5305A
MSEIHVADDHVSVAGSLRTLVHRPREVTLDDGTRLLHESRGGTLSAVWAGDLGDVFVEVLHPGHGPEGGELVLVVQEQDVVSLGDLVASETPVAVGPEWPVAVDLVLGLMSERTRVITSSGEVTRADVEDFHQRLLGVLHG